MFRDFIACFLIHLSSCGLAVSKQIYFYGIEIAVIACTNSPLNMKNYLHRYAFLLAFIAFLACEKQDPLVPIPVPKASYISFSRDTLAVRLTVTSTRKENVGNLFAVAIDGKMSDSIINRSSLIIRLAGDSTGLYNHQQIFASYTDSLGNSFSTEVADTINTVRITKIEKIQNGNVDGDFTIRVSNFTKSKILILGNGKISTLFSQ